MTAFVLALCAVTLSLTTAVAGLSTLLNEPLVRTRDPLGTDRGAERWFVVRSSQGTWYLNGEPISTRDLASSLSGRKLPEGGVGFLPTNMRTAGDVGADLHWLQQVSGGAVTLQLEMRDLHP